MFYWLCAIVGVFVLVGIAIIELVVMVLHESIWRKDD